MTLKPRFLHLYQLAYGGSHQMAMLLSLAEQRKASRAPTSPAALGQAVVSSCAVAAQQPGMEDQLNSLHKILSLQLTLSRLSSLPGRCPSAVPAPAQWRGRTWSLEAQLWGRAVPQERHRQCAFRRERHLTHLSLSGPRKTTPGNTPGNTRQLGLLGLFFSGIPGALAL